MSTRVLYFTAGPVPTGPELSEINAIAAVAGISLGIRNASQDAVGGAEPEEADYVAGSPPEPYDDTEDYPAYVVGNIPTAGLVDEGDTIVLTDGAGTTLDCVLVVTAGVPTLTCPGTAKIIKNGVEFLASDKSGSYVDGWTPTIANGVATTMLAS